MVERCDRRDTQLSVNHQRRFAKPYRRAKELLDDGRIGDLRRIEVGGPDLYDYGSHLFDMCGYLTDQAPVEWVLAQVEYTEENVQFGMHTETQGLARWRYEDGVDGLASTGEDGLVGCHLRLLGSDGVIEIGREDGPPLRVRADGADWMHVDTAPDGIYRVHPKTVWLAADAVLSRAPVGPDRAFEWARGENIPVSRAWIEEAYADIPAGEKTTWSSLDEMEANTERVGTAQRIRQEGVDEVPFRREDERYRYPEVVEEREKNVVVVNIRDVSGSMRQKKRELVERTFTPLDWYLQGKYDNAEFVYIAHDADAWEVERDEFFGIRSGGGTRISSAYDLAAELLEEYPWNEWNRYVFAAGDSENSSNDTEEHVIPLMEQIPANLHAYVETQPSGNAINATHAEEVERNFRGDNDVAVAYVSSPDDVVDAIYEILSTEEEA